MMWKKVDASLTHHNFSRHNDLSDFFGSYIKHVEDIRTLQRCQLRCERGLMRLDTSYLRIYRFFMELDK